MMKCLYLFIGHGICKNLSKSVSLPLATDDARLVGKECITILHQLRAVPEDLRGVKYIRASMRF